MVRLTRVQKHVREKADPGSWQIPIFTSKGPELHKCSSINETGFMPLHLAFLQRAVKWLSVKREPKHKSNNHAKETWLSNFF